MTEWAETFKDRMDAFARSRSSDVSDLPVAIKVRVASGHFDREHSPEAFALIDKQLEAMPAGTLECLLEEYESGPEVLAWVAVTPAGLALDKSAVDLVTAILKARSESVRSGAQPIEDLEVLVGRWHGTGGIREERVIRAGWRERVDRRNAERLLNGAVQRLYMDNEPQS
jgi:hypothetical protein